MNQPRAPKRPRTERARSGAIEVTERDTDLMVLVGLTRIISLDQLARELFVSVDRARRRIRQLFDAQYLIVTLLAATKSNLVSLSRKGADYARSQAPELATQLHTAGPIRLPEIEHHLLGIDARLYAAALGERRQAPLLSWAHGAGTLAMSCGLDAHGLEPEALAQFAVGAERVVIAIEVVSNHKPVATLARRLGRYRAVLREARLDALWVAVADATTGRTVAGLVAEHELGEFVRVLDREHLAARPVRELRERIGSPDGPKGPIGVDTPSADSRDMTSGSTTPARR